MRALRRNRVGPLLTMLLTAGCASNPTPGADDQLDGGTGTAMASGFVCSAVDEELGPDGTLRGRSGVYRLILVLNSSDAVQRSTEGELWLRSQPPGSRDFAGAPTRLIGSTDIDVEAVDAFRVGDPASEDPDAPGVLVLESDGPDGRSILLRLGSDANRRDVFAFDGAYTVLVVRRIDGGGFAGSWRSATWDKRAEGYFCARSSGE